MLEVPRRHQWLAVALPATFTLDIPHLREKTARIGLLARSLAIFRVEEAVIYQDQDSRQAHEEARLFEKILKFQETPQYLRKHLFKMDPDLEFAGVLPPLRSPHHPDREEPRRGQLREGVVVSSGPSSKVDAGFKDTVAVESRLERSKRVTIRITRVSPSLEGELVDRSGLHIYWGFMVSRETRTLGELVKRGDRDLIISTSRKGTDIRQVITKLRDRWKTASRPMLLFGSPREGVPEILARSNDRASELEFNINTVPDQGVETVRTEEALLGTLAVLNLLEEA